MRSATDLYLTKKQEGFLTFNVPVPYFVIIDLNNSTVITPH
jgi:hypothetical protein